MSALSFKNDKIHYKLKNKKQKTKASYASIFFLNFNKNVLWQLKGTWKARM